MCLSKINAIGNKKQYSMRRTFLLELQIIFFSKGHTLQLCPAKSDTILVKQNRNVVGFNQGSLMHLK